MLDLAKYDSLGAALRDALAQWPEEVCLIEADRENERSRLTYRQFGEAAEPLAAAIEEFGFAAGERAAIIMTNQPKWLISAYADIFRGRCSRAARLQALAWRAFAASGPLQSANSDGRVPAVARHHANARFP